MIDQERMKSYIEMGFEKEKALEICQQEEKDAQKAAAKEAKQTENKTENNGPEELKTGPENLEEFKNDLKSAMEETVKNQVQEALKADKLQEVLKGSGETQTEKTTTDILIDRYKEYNGIK